MPTIWPTFDIPTLASVTPVTVVPDYPPSPLFDYRIGDVVRDGGGRVVMADGWTAWVQWCVNACLTERYSFIAYTPSFGVEMESAIRDPRPNVAQSKVAATIAEALVVDPRTLSVSDFSFSHAGDGMFVSFTIVPVVGPKTEIQLAYSSG